MAKRRLYLIAYDISDERIRSRARCLLKSYAVGGQKSLFECLFSEYELDVLCGQLAELIHAEDKLQIALLPEGGLRAYYGCARPLDYEFFMVV